MASAATGGEGGDGGSDQSSGGATPNEGGENMATSVEKKLTAAALGGSGRGGDTPAPAAAPTSATAPSGDAILETKKQKMANLSFAQRRHELSRRIVQYSKSVAHVHALTAASLPKSHSAILQQKVHDPPPRLSAIVQASSDAMQFVKSGWVSQDEAQDALYFHHDGLWKASLGQTRLNTARSMKDSWQVDSITHLQFLIAHAARTSRDAASGEGV